MMQYAWAAVFLLAGFMGCIEEYHAIQRGRAITPWGSACGREASPRSFWLLTTFGIVGSCVAVVLGLLLAVA